MKHKDCKARCKFPKTKNAMYIWETPDVKIVFHEGCMTAYDDYKYVKDMDDVLYLYYTVSIYTRPENGGKGWKLLKSHAVCDEPAVPDMVNILRSFLSGEIDANDYQADTGGSIRSYHMASGHYLSEDYYEVVHYVDAKENTEWFSMYAGLPCKADHAGSSNGINVHLSKKDVRKFYKTISGFVQDIIETYNLECKRFVSVLLASRYIDDQCLVCMNQEGGYSSIFCKGDEITDLAILVGEPSANNYYSEWYHNVTISSVGAGNIVLSGGYLCSDDQITRDLCDEVIPCNQILYISRNVEKEVSWGKSQIAEDFFNRIPDSWKQDIQKLSVNSCALKYKEPMINRYWMYRDEHCFDDTDTGQCRDDVVINTVKRIFFNRMHS